MPRVVELAGGVGGAKLADGLQAVLGADLTVIVNTGDDFVRHGLTIWPDHDTVAYTLAGLDDAERGWGLAVRRGMSWTRSRDSATTRGSDSATATLRPTSGGRIGLAMAGGPPQWRGSSRHGSE